MPGFVNDHAFWKLPMKGLEAAQAELADYRLSVDMFYFNQFDQNDFIRRVKYFPFNKIEGVLFAPVFQEESLTFIDTCISSKVPVVLFNSILDNVEYSAFVGQDAYQSGRVAGRLINYGLEHRRDVLILNMSARKEHYAHIVKREKGFRNYFEENKDRIERLIHIDLNGASDEDLDLELRNAFETYRVGGIFVTNSRVYKVAEYLQRNGNMNIRLVGYDLMPESVAFLKKGYIDFLLSQQPEEQASRGLTALFNLVAFNVRPQREQYMPIDIITRENLDYYKPDQQVS